MASKQRSQRQLWADVIKKKPLYVKDNVGSNLHVGKQLEQFGDRTDSSGQLEGCEARSETSEPLSQCDYVEPSANDDVEEWGNGPDVQATTTKKNGGKSEPKPIWTSQHINQASYVNFEGRIEYILYVAGIPTLHANKEYLANIFGPFGQIVNIVIKVHQNGAYAFLEYRNKNSVSRALELAGDSHRYYYADRYLIVDSYKKNVYCKST
ncbi:hypothetical protein HDE_07365 [Halotydeus destructor]|nr:hypothetical protein HDE_07365 [Halotydeus destructor]